jgi:CO/xanthine dehydrogenase FAD-binding subunit
MRAWLAQYSMERAANLNDALARLASGPNHWTPFAGGTDLMVVLETGRMPPRTFLDISRIEELRGIQVGPEHVTIGALVTYTELLENRVITTEFPLIAEAARQTGAIAIQNRGTVGGNIANGSPAADLPPALLVYDAEIEVASIRGRRWMPYDRFHLGYKEMDLAPDELIVATRMPRRSLGTRIAVGAGFSRPDSWKQTYRKVGTRRAQAISKICFAAAVRIENDQYADARIALGSVAPTVVRARATEQALTSRPVSTDTIRAARAALENEISPIDDVRSSAQYRRLVAGNLLEEFLG